MSQFLANTWYAISQPYSEKVICNQVLLNYFFSVIILLDYLNKLPKEYLYQIINFFRFEFIKIIYALENIYIRL